MSAGSLKVNDNFLLIIAIPCFFVLCDEPLARSPRCDQSLRFAVSCSLARRDRSALENIGHGRAFAARPSASRSPWWGTGKPAAHSRPLAPTRYRGQRKMSPPSWTLLTDVARIDVH